MATLKTLSENNPSLTIHSVKDDAFIPYGRVLPYDAESLIALTRETIPMPSQGVVYHMACPELEAHPFFAAIQNEWLGEAPAQLGICLGHNDRLNALEYHRASEFNIAVTDMVLLLAQRQKMRANTLAASDVEAFFVPAGTCIEVYATAMHYCPLQTDTEGFISLVILPKGTNGALDRPHGAQGECRLLMGRDKWLICHPDCADLVAQGAFPGLMGENIRLFYET